MLVTEKKLRQIVRHILIENNADGKIKSIDDFKKVLESSKAASISFAGQSDEIRKVDRTDNVYSAAELDLEFEVFKINQDLFPNLVVAIKPLEKNEKDLEVSATYIKERAEKIIPAFIKRVVTWLSRRVIKYFESELAKNKEEFLKNINGFCSEFKRIDLIAGKGLKRRSYYVRPSYVSRDLEGYEDQGVIMLPLQENDSNQSLIATLYHEFLHHFEQYFKELDIEAKKARKSLKFVGPKKGTNSQDKYLGLDVKVDNKNTKKLLAHALTKEEYKKLFNYTRTASKVGEVFSIQDLLTYLGEDVKAVKAIYSPIMYFAPQNLEHMYDDHDEVQGGHMTLAIRTLYEFADRTISIKKSNKDQYYKFFLKLLKLQFPSFYYRDNPEVSRALAPLMHSPEHNAKALVTYYELAKIDTDKSNDAVKV